MNYSSGSGLPVKFNVKFAWRDRFTHSRKYERRKRFERVGAIHELPGRFVNRPYGVVEHLVIF